MSLIEAARAAGWRVHDTVTRLIRRFNERGLGALDDLARSGHPRSYGPAERARIEQELQRSPDLKEGQRRGRSPRCNAPYVRLPMVCQR